MGVYLDRYKATVGNRTPAAPKAQPSSILDVIKTLGRKTWDYTLAPPVRFARESSAADINALKTGGIPAFLKSRRDFARELPSATVTTAKELAAPVVGTAMSPAVEIARALQKPQTPEEQDLYDAPPFPGLGRVPTVRAIFKGQESETPAGKATGGAIDAGMSLLALFGLANAAARPFKASPRPVAPETAPKLTESPALRAPELPKASSEPPRVEPVPLPLRDAVKHWREANRQLGREQRAFDENLPNPNQQTLFPIEPQAQPVAPKAPVFKNVLRTNERPIALGPEGSTGSTVIDVLRHAKVNERSPFALRNDTPTRVIEGIFGKKAEPVLNEVVRPRQQAVTELADFSHKLKTEAADVFKRLGINRRSGEAKAVGDFIEGTKTLPDLVKEYGPAKADNLVAASEYGRKVYRDLLTRVNAVYRSHGYAPIPERPNYITHTKQMGAFLDRFGSFLSGKADTLPTEISGINVATKPGRRWFGFGKQRTGGSTHEGIVVAMDKYIDAVAPQIHLTPVIQRLRKMNSFLGKESPAWENPQRLSNFKSWLERYTDQLAGKKNMIDRGVEDTFGRKWYRVFDWAKQRTGANMVGGNISTAVTQFIPLTQSLATTAKTASLRGLTEALFAPFRDPRMIDGRPSAFLTRRFSRGHIGADWGTRVQDTAGFLMKIVDEFVANTVVGGKYYEAKGKGLGPQEAMRLADGYAERLMADRSIGSMPMIFESKTLGPFTQFQLEVLNQTKFIGRDIPKHLGFTPIKAASAVTQLALYSYLYNDLYEKLTGRRPALDPIHLMQTLVGQLQNGASPTEILNPTSNSATSELANMLPYSSVFTGGRIPLSGVLPDVAGMARGEKSPSKEALKPLFGLLPPLGGSQIKKSLTGGQAYSRGYSQTNKGNFRFGIEQSTSNLLRSLFFGEYAVPESGEYFRGQSNVPEPARIPDILKALLQ